MRQSVTAISAVIVILFTVTSESARAYFSCRDEKSLTVCQPEDLLTSGPKDRIKQSRILFETNNCLVGEVSASGQSNWTAAPYACGFRRLRPGIPIERGHAFRSKAATFSDEGDRAPLPAW